MRAGRNPKRWGGAVGRLRRAWKGMWSVWALGQALLCGGVATGVVLWLALPDETEADRLLTMVLLVGGLLLTAWAEGAVLLAARRAGERRAAWESGVWVLGGCMVFALGALVLDAGSLQDRERAVYLINRTFLWHVLTVQGLERAESVVWWGLRCVWAAVLLPVVVEGGARGWRGLRERGWAAPLGRGLFWVVVLVLAGVAARVTETVFRWRPVVPVLVQIALTVGKTAVLFAVDVGSLCLVVSLTGTYLRDVARRRARKKKGLARARV